MRTMIAAMAAVMLAGSAQAGTLFADNFDSEGTAGTSTLNYNSFANWTVDGQVDLVQTPEFGIDCSVKCVDLDGSSGPGKLTSTAIAYQAGKQLTLQFDVGGSQRVRGATDSFLFTVNFGQATDITGFTNLGGFDPAQLGSGSFFGLTTIGTYNESISSTRGFVTYALAFTPTAAGTLNLLYWTPSGDNIGPLLDNVLVSQVPEPSSWMLLIAGFGLVGYSARRRRAVAA